MKIGVIGGGAIGMLYATRLSEEFSVMLFTRTRQQAEAISRDGVTEIAEGQERNIRIEARPIEELGSSELDIVFVAVKQYHLANILSQLNQIERRTPLVFLQNGMGHLSLLHDLSFSAIYVSTVEHGVQRVGETAFRLSGLNRTNIALFKGGSPILPVFLQKVPPHFPFIYKENARDMLLEKMAANAVINPLTAILRIPNGELISNRSFFPLAQQAFREFEAVFYEGERMEAFEAVIEICKKTAANRSSMLKDMEEGRPTEIEAILGYVLEEAVKKEINTPLLHSLYLMINGLQAEIER
ncbi:2-dehydropantoate 2-reductase [Bacillus ectoiniformans]|uniref:2-dehydropantoate 2-reductase n=1 Tax=Bacillus ectoiniformans TaxID=1494429 RepID=UPI0019574B82|nr:2-dehydropantoate 2-reductase [Bacillus ectoiniformans]